MRILGPSLWIQQGRQKLSGRGDAKRGEQLWNDRSLGKSGLACANCHVNDYTLMNPTFKAAYPHRVAMPYEQAGVDQVNTAEMVQFCMLVPMATDPLPWDSDDLASLAAHVDGLRDGYQPMPGTVSNPCNPCGARNPCGR